MCGKEIIVKISTNLELIPDEFRSCRANWPLARVESSLMAHFLTIRQFHMIEIHTTIEWIAASWT